MKKSFDLTTSEWILWSVSAAVIVLSFGLSGVGGVINVIASLVGVTALLFVAKGRVIGQVLVVVFALLYGFISLFCRYYGEAITHLGMSTPAAIVSAISWWKHPYQDTREVTVGHLSTRKWIGLMLTTAAATTVFYVVLEWLDTANLFLSTLSVATSFAASYLTFFRSPYYAIGYALNDVVLIALWVLMSMEDVSYIPMIACFVMFLVNDLYGFYRWRKRQKNQC